MFISLMLMIFVFGFAQKYLFAKKLEHLAIVIDLCRKLYQAFFAADHSTLCFMRNQALRFIQAKYQVFLFIA